MQPRANGLELPYLNQMVVAVSGRSTCSRRLHHLIDGYKVRSGAAAGAGCSQVLMTRCGEDVFWSTKAHEVASSVGAPLAKTHYQMHQTSRLHIAQRTPLAMLHCGDFGSGISAGLYIHRSEFRRS